MAKFPTCGVSESRPDPKRLRIYDGAGGPSVGARGRNAARDAKIFERARSAPRSGRRQRAPAAWPCVLPVGRPQRGRNSARGSARCRRLPPRGAGRICHAWHPRSCSRAPRWRAMIVAPQSHAKSHRFDAIRRRWRPLTVGPPDLLCCSHDRHPYGRCCGGQPRIRRDVQGVARSLERSFARIQQVEMSSGERVAKLAGVARRVAIVVHVVGPCRWM